MLSPGLFLRHVEFLFSTTSAKLKQNNCLLQNTIWRGTPGFLPNAELENRNIIHSGGVRRPILLKWFKIFRSLIESCSSLIGHPQRLQSISFHFIPILSRDLKSGRCNNYFSSSAPMNYKLPLPISQSLNNERKRENRVNRLCLEIQSN